MQEYNLIIPVGLKPYPDKYEEMVAKICAKYFQSDIIFVKRSIATTPDIQIVKTAEFWEIKNIQGNSKNTIEDNLKRASKQADNIIISLLRSKMTSTQAIARIRYFLMHPRRNVRRVILITKDHKVIDFGNRIC